MYRHSGRLPRHQRVKYRGVPKNVANTVKEKYKWLPTEHYDIRFEYKFGHD